MFIQLGLKQRGLTPTNKCPWYDTKQYVDEASVILVLWRMKYTCCILTPAKLSKTKCTYVNNRCIWSKISGGNLNCRGVELSANCDARRKYVGVQLLYNPGDRKFRSVGEKMLEWEPCPSKGWAPRPPVEQPRKTGKKGCDSQKSWRGQICCSLCSVSNSLSHTTLWIKWDVYFSKELCPLVFIVLNMFLHAYV